MTQNDFGGLAEERDRQFARQLYHSVSLVRLASREWVMAELKELGIEAIRLLDIVSVTQRHQLGQLTEELQQIQTTTQTKFSIDDSVAFEATRNEVFAHVNEPASNMLAGFKELVAIVEVLKIARDKIEAIAGTVDP